MTLLFAMFTMVILSSCGAECRECVANGEPTLTDAGTVCPEDFTTSDEFDDFITLYEFNGGSCN